MAGRNNSKSNVVTYVFEGEVLGLQSAITRVQQEMKTLVNSLKAYQQGTLTSTQQATTKSIESMLGIMDRVNAHGSDLTKKQKERALAAGKYALRMVGQLNKQELQLAAQKEKDLAAIAAQRDLNLSPAGQASAGAHANYMETMVKSLGMELTQDTQNSIMAAVDNYRAVIVAMKEGKASSDDLNNATQQLQDTYRSYNETLRTAKNTYVQMNKGVSDFNDLLRQGDNYGTMMVQSMTFWIQLIQKFIQLMKEGIQSYANWVESLNYLQVALGGTNEQFSEFIKLQQLALGIDPTELSTTAATFLQFGNSIGFANNQAVAFSEQMTMLAQDLASLYNTDLTSMMNALKSGMAGQTKALQRFGISVHDSTLNEWLLTKGMNVQMNQLSETQQAYVRWAYIVEQTANAHGDLARTLKSPANQMKILSAQVKLLIQNISGLCNVAIYPLIVLLNTVLQPINAFLQGLESIAASGFSKAVASDTDALDDETDAAKEAASYLTKLDEINQASASNNKIGYDIDLTGLMGTYNNMVTSSANLVKIMYDLGEAMAPIWAMFADTDTINGFAQLIDYISYILVPVEAILKGISIMFDALPEPLKNVLAAVLQLASALVSIAVALAVIKTLTATQTFKAFITILSTMWGWITKIVAALWSKIAALTSDSVATSANALASRSAAVAAGSEATAQHLAAAAYWKKAIAVIAAAGALALLVAAAVLGGIAMIQGAQSSANSSIDAQKSANGGVANGPALTWVGEGNYSEAIVPLGNSPQFKGMQEGLAAAVVAGLASLGITGGTRSSGNNQPIILQMDGRELARALWPKLADTQMQTGVHLK